MPLPFEPFDTERLHIRLVEPQDTDAFFRWYSDPETCRYWSEPPMTERSQAESRVSRLTLSNGEQGSLALVMTLDGKSIGTLSAFGHSESNRRCELGYSLDREHWGKGYMREALKALLQMGFDKWNLHRYEADTDPRNVNSIKLLTSLGFKQEGLLRERWIVAEEVSDTAFFGLIRSDWQP
ncbi:MAG: GNAT family protein [bacterium]